MFSHASAVGVLAVLVVGAAAIDASCDAVPSLHALRATPAVCWNNGTVDLYCPDPLRCCSAPGNRSGDCCKPKEQCCGRGGACCMSCCGSGLDAKCCGSGQTCCGGSCCDSICFSGDRCSSLAKAWVIAIIAAASFAVLLVIIFAVIGGTIYYRNKRESEATGKKRYRSTYRRRNNIEMTDAPVAESPDTKALKQAIDIVAEGILIALVKISKNELEVNEGMSFIALAVVSAIKKIRETGTQLSSEDQVNVSLYIVRQLMGRAVRGGMSEDNKDDFIQTIRTKIQGAFQAMQSQDSKERLADALDVLNIEESTRLIGTALVAVLRNCRIRSGESLHEYEQIFDRWMKHIIEHICLEVKITHLFNLKTPNRVVYKKDFLRL
eukprot:m51a1_g836 hypothetical protein (380) ;mRNA; r:746310-756953